MGTFIYNLSFLNFLLFVGGAFNSCEYQNHFTMCDPAFLRSVGASLARLLFLAIAIAMIVMGAVYLNYCPAEKMIPIYLVVAGVVYLLQNALNYDERQSVSNPSVRCSNVILALFSLAWFIAGNVWIFRKRNYMPLDEECATSLYSFAFGLLITKYIIFGLSLCCIPIFMCLCWRCYIFGRFATYLEDLLHIRKNLNITMAK